MTLLCCGFVWYDLHSNFIMCHISIVYDCLLHIHVSNVNFSRSVTMVSSPDRLTMVRSQTQHTYSSESVFCNPYFVCVCSDFYYLLHDFPV